MLDIVDIRAHPYWSAFFFAIGVLAFRHVYTTIDEERKIRRLGGHGWIRSSWWPFGLDFIVTSVKAGNRFDDFNFWVNGVFATAHPDRPYTTEVSLCGQRMIFTADEENIKAILASQFNDYGKGEQFHHDWKDFLGDSIFTTDGSQWHGSRALIRPQFIKDRVSDLHVFEEHIQILLPQLVSKTAGQAVNIGELLYRYTLDSATQFLLGQSVDSLVTPQSRFADAFGEVQRVQSMLARAGPINKFYPRKAFRAHLRVLDEFMQPFIERTLRLSPQEIEEQTKTEQGYTFLHALAAFTQDRKVLRDQLIAVLLAARDTTAATLTWLFYHLSKNPEIYAKLRNEILSSIGPNQAPTYADLKTMKYLQHSLNEVLRLYPAVPYNIRVSLKDTTLPSGGGADGTSPIGILRGTPIGYSTIVLQRRADIYPPTSDKFPDHTLFAPERWEHWTPKAWTYIPFNGGPRICVGQPFALTEMGYTVVRILQRFARIESAMTVEPKEKAEIVGQPSTGINVLFYEQ